MTNTIKQINNNTIQLTYYPGTNKEFKTVYYKVIPGVDDFTIRDLSSYIKYKGEHYA
tara:strand:- start:1045 stop:1215 length:171 start_codon:yes stop_codon:yes gene_type:complete